MKDSFIQEKENGEANFLAGDVIKEDTDSFRVIPPHVVDYLRDNVNNFLIIGTDGKTVNGMCYVSDVDNSVNILNIIVAAANSALLEAYDRSDFELEEHQ